MNSASAFFSHRSSSSFGLPFLCTILSAYVMVNNFHGFFSVAFAVYSKSHDCHKSQMAMMPFDLLYHCLKWWIFIFKPFVLTPQRKENRSRTRLFGALLKQLLFHFNCVFDSLLHCAHSGKRCNLFQILITNFLIIFTMRTFFLCAVNL